MLLPFAVTVITIPVYILHVEVSGMGFFRLYGHCWDISDYSISDLAEHLPIFLLGSHSIQPTCARFDDFAVR